MAFGAPSAAAANWLVMAPEDPDRTDGKTAPDLLNGAAEQPRPGKPARKSPETTQNHRRDAQMTQEKTSITQGEALVRDAARLSVAPMMDWTDFI